MRLAVVASHPIQYYAPLFRELARRLDLKVFFAHKATQADQASAGFSVGFDWDIDLLVGYNHLFLHNVAERPGLDYFTGCDTPEIGARLRGGAFDAVLVQGWYLKTFLQAVFAAKRLGMHVLVRGDSHLGTPRSIFKKTIKAVAYPPLLRTFDAALYVGERSRAYWEHYHYPKDRLFFSPHCVDTEWFSARATRVSRATLRMRLGLDSDAKVILFAGKLVEFKRPLDIIAAVALLRANDSKIVVLVAGSGPLHMEMIAVATASDVPLFMLGFCNQSEMPAAYAAADILVLPSSGRETWGLVANEALACGLPVVLSDVVGAAPDLAGDKAAGRVFPVGDVAALAKALYEVLTAPPAPEAIAKKSQAYSVMAAAEGIETALAATISKHKNRSTHST